MMISTGLVHVLMCNDVCVCVCACVHEYRSLNQMVQWKSPCLVVMSADQTCKLSLCILISCVQFCCHDNTYNTPCLLYRTLMPPPPLPLPVVSLPAPLKRPRQEPGHSHTGMNPTHTLTLKSLHSYILLC